MTILWENDPRTAEHYSFALGADLVVVESASAASRALLGGEDALVVIGASVDLEAACLLAESLRVERPEVGTVLLRRRLDVSVLAQALRSGVREVVQADDLSGLTEACRRSLELSGRLHGTAGQPRAAAGRIITVFSAKGGVGKTTFSTNIATYLASSGARTLLLDLDLAFGDVAISLQLDPQPLHDLEGVVAMAGHLDERGLRSVLVRHERSGLDVLCAPANPSGAERIPASLVTEVLRVARQHYEFVIIDTPPAITDQVLAGFDLSDRIVLIATLDIPALKNLRVTLETLDLLGSPVEARVVALNRSDAKVGLSAADVVTAIRHDIGVLVPGSVDVPAAVNHGQVIVLDQPKHPVSLAIKALADRFIRVPSADRTTSATDVTPRNAVPRRLFAFGSRT